MKKNDTNLLPLEVQPTEKSVDLGKNVFAFSKMGLEKEIILSIL